MPIFHSSVFWFMAYLVGAVAIALFAAPALRCLGQRLKLADWITSQSFRWWLAILWPGFLVGLLAAAVIGLIVVVCVLLPLLGKGPPAEAELAEEDSADASGEEVA